MEGVANTAAPVFFEHINRIDLAIVLSIFVARRAEANKSCGCVVDLRHKQARDVAIRKLFLPGPQSGGHVKIVEILLRHLANIGLLPRCDVKLGYVG